MWQNAQSLHTTINNQFDDSPWLQEWTDRCRYAQVSSLSHMSQIVPCLYLIEKGNSGNRFVVEVYRDMVHVLTMFSFTLESKMAWKRSGSFIDAQFYTENDSEWRSKLLFVDLHR
jgi:hypothetical protein